jgi:tetratricopeptide (TPR) repeat protein
MSTVPRDYIERMIEQCAEAIAQIAAMVRTGEFDRALIMIQKTSDLVLGPNRSLYERLDADSAVELLGRYELDRLRMYAALLGEEGLIREARGQVERANECFGRALRMYSAIDRSGARLMSADWDRIEALQAKV